MRKSRDKKNGHKLACSGKRVQGEYTCRRKHLSGKNRLKIIGISTIQNFYGGAIRDNNGNPPKMSDLYGLFWTTTQTQKVTLNMINVWREKCWSLYQRDQRTGLNTYIPTKNTSARCYPWCCQTCIYLSSKYSVFGAVQKMPQSK